MKIKEDKDKMDSSEKLIKVVSNKPSLSFDSAAAVNSPG